MGAFHTVTLDALVIDDERSLRELALYCELERVVREGGLRFRVAPEGSSHATWSRVLFLNLTFWHGAQAGADQTSDVLSERRIPADVVAHVGWHHLAARAFAQSQGSAESMLMGEAIASAFDLYLIGELLRRGAPASEFLSSQTEAMSASLAEHGYDERDVSRWLESVAESPTGAFESLRGLLFDASASLLACDTVDQAVAVFDRLEGHRFAPLLHHFELSNWTLHSRAYARDKLHRDEAVRALDRALRESEDSVALLRDQWVLPALSRPEPPRT
jgi:hypothetical protein